MAQNPEEMAASMRANLPEKTGRQMSNWSKLLKKEGLDRHGEIVSWLKKEHGVTHGYANLISQDFRNPPAAAGSSEDLVEAQYSGPKESLRPVYDALLKKITKFGKDVDVSPKKAYVSLRRSKQFALIQPSTKTRVDVGIQLPDTKPTQRLEKSGSFNAMVSHRVRLESVDDVDEQLVAWLKKAYERA